MNEKCKELVYSTEILTEDGVFAVGSSGINAVTKNGGELLVIDPISLGVIDQLGTYPEAKTLRISPNSEYVCFMDGSLLSCLRVIEFATKKCFVIQLNSRFLVNNFFWSSNSRFVAFISELGVYVGIYELEGEKTFLEGPSCDSYDCPLALFSPNVDYFSMVKIRCIITYSTDTWSSHSKFTCISNPCGLIYTDSCSVAVWNSSGAFVVYNLIGEEIFKRKASVSSRVKAVKICQENRVIILATFNDKIELYDVLSWDKLYCFDYPCSIKSTQNNIVMLEPMSPLMFKKMHFCHQNVQPQSSLSLNPLRNICDEFKIKNMGKYYLKFSLNNEYLACYTPGYDKTVWIRSVKTGNLIGVILLDAGPVQGLKWHPEKEILAIITLDSVVFWLQGVTLAVYSKSPLKSFHWIKSKLIICSMATQTEGVFICIGNG